VTIVSLILAVIVFHIVANSISTLILRNYIKTFDAVKYENQLVPEIEKEGYYTITTDDDIRIMQINDIHIGGGFATLKNDKKTIYEVMTMVQKEKPDLLVVLGDSTFCVPAVGFNGGGTLNNKSTAKTVMKMFDKLGVYYTVTFGNHDTEAFDFTNRQKLGEVYASGYSKYCIFQSDFDEYGVTNQCVLLKNTDGKIRKALMLIDSNDYIDTSLSATINGQYDTINDLQVNWAADTIKSLSKSNGEDVKSLYFFHIPTGEFEAAYQDLKANDFKDTETTQLINGFWDEPILYGGRSNTEIDPVDQDSLFETLGPDGLNTMEAIFCGHDHVNNAVVVYKGVTLSYGYSLDNIAYTGINRYGLQRGAVLITVKPDGTWSEEHKNAYKDYGVSTNKFVTVDTESYLYENPAP